MGYLNQKNFITSLQKVTNTAFHYKKKKSKQSMNQQINIFNVSANCQTVSNHKNANSIINEYVLYLQTHIY